MELLAKRLPDVSTKMRPSLSISVAKALASVKEILSTRKEPLVVVPALKAVQSVATTMSPGEEGALADLVPLALSASKEKDTALPALGALAALSYVIPYPFSVPLLMFLKSQARSSYHPFLPIDHFPERHSTSRARLR